MVSLRLTRTSQPTQLLHSAPVPAPCCSVDFAALGLPPTGPNPASPSAQPPLPSHLGQPSTKPSTEPSTRPIYY